LEDPSADIDMIPDTQYSNAPHPTTSTQLASPTYPHKSESPNCEEELLHELSLWSGDVQEWSRTGGELPPAVAGGRNECKMDWSSANEKEVKCSPTLGSKNCPMGGESPTAKLPLAKRRTWDTEVKYNDSDYCSGADMVLSSHEKSSLLCEEESLLQKDMGGWSPVYAWI